MSQMVNRMTRVQFLTEPTPPRDHAIEVAPGIRRIVANNPGPMTYHGTNTYLIETPSGCLVVDPGPHLPSHLDTVLREAGPIAAILISHAHNDHAAGSAWLRAASGAPVYAFGPRPNPDHRLTCGERLFGWRVLHTPGHLDDHVCLLRDDGVVLTADHVMGWSSSIIDPVEGDMTAYLAALDRLIGEPAQLYLPGHGPAIDDPISHANALRRHRLDREAEILACLEDGVGEVVRIVTRLYPALPIGMHTAAARNVLAHLQKLSRDGRASPTSFGWSVPARAAVLPKPPAAVARQGSQPTN